MRDFEKKVFNSLNQGYINISDFKNSNMSKKDKESFSNDFFNFMNSFNYMGMDEEVAKHFAHCIISHRPDAFLAFTQYVTLLAVSLKENNIESDLRSEASVTFLKEKVSNLESVVCYDLDYDKKDTIKKLMLDIQSKTHNTIFQSFIRTLSICCKKLFNEEKLDTIITKKEAQPTEVFCIEFLNEENYFPFI